MRLYATPGDVAEWIGLDTPPDNAKTLIRHASLLVESATRLDRYNVDMDGKPTEYKVAEAFRDATCEQVALWHANDMNPAKGFAGQTGQVQSQSVPGGSVSYSGALSAAEMGAAVTSLSDSAIHILKNAGLGKGQVTYL